MTRSMTRLALVLVLLCVAPVLAQEDDGPEVRLADTIAATGLRLVDGVRYAISAFQPSGPAQRLVAEIALPSDAEVVEAFDTESLVYRGTRTGPDGLSLIWTAETLPADQPLGPFAFTLREPLAQPASVFIQWTGDDPNEIRVISTYAAPRLVEAANDIDRVVVGAAGTGDFVPVGTTGVSLYLAPGVVPDETALLVGEMSTDLNPPPEYGAIWWCSGLALAGLPEGASAQVIVPLRRPLPPLTETTLFALQPDNTWHALPDKGIVTLDGQSVAYVHPGGVIATGVDGELQPAEQPPVEVPPQDAPPPPPPPAEPPPPVEPPPPPPDVVLPANPPPVEPPPPADQPPTQPPTDVPLPTTAPLSDAVSAGSESGGRPAIPTAAFTREVIQITAPTNTPPATATPAPNGAPTLASISDGSSNTVTIGEVTPTSGTVNGQIGDGSVRFVTLAPFIPSLTPTPLPDSQAIPTTSFVTLAPFVTQSPTTAGITDGSSNTILIGEVTRTPSSTPTPRFVTLAPFVTQTPTAAGITDGSSNTLLIGEATRTPTSTPTLRFVTLAPFTTATPTAASITDGSSNTLLIGEATRTATPTFVTLAPIIRSLTPTPLPDSVAATALASATPTPSGITDGTSNTLLTGEATATSAPPSSTSTDAPRLQFVTLAPFVPDTATAQPTVGSITDGSSTTLLVGEVTSTPTALAVVPDPVGDQFDVLRRTRDQVQARGASSAVAVQAIGQIFPQIGQPPTPAGSPTVAPPRPSATANPARTAVPRPSRTPGPTPTLLPEPSIRFSLPAPACAGSAPGTAFCVAADQTIRTCSSGACLSRRSANQICIQLAGQSQPVCTRTGP